MAKKTPKHEPETLAAKARKKDDGVFGVSNHAGPADDHPGVTIHSSTDAEGNRVSIKEASDVFASEEAMHEHLHFCLSHQAFAIAAPIIKSAETSPDLAAELKDVRKRIKKDEAFRAGVLRGIQFSTAAAIQTMRHNQMAIATATPEQLGPYYTEALRTAFTDDMKTTSVASAVHCLAFKLFELDKDLDVVMSMLGEASHMSLAFFAPLILADNAAPQTSVN